MENPPKVDCPHCLRHIWPIVRTATYSCPGCGGVILPSQIAAVLDEIRNEQDSVAKGEAPPNEA